jgi:hypothetical protein
MRDPSSETTIEINTKKLSAFTAVVALTAFSVLFGGVAADAHSGGLNSQGCHAGREPYHCHRSPNEMVGNRLRCDLGSRSVECQGGNRSATQPSSSVRSYQAQLMQHCPYLPSNFADGVVGPATRRALIRFQTAYGLSPDGVYGQQTARALAGPVTGACR